MIKKLIIFVAILAFLAPSVSFAAASFDVDTGGTLETSLISWYNLEADSTDEFSTNDGTDTSITYGTAKIENGAIYNASTDVITLPHLTGTGSWSASFFVKLDSEIGSGRYDLFWTHNNTIDVSQGLWYEYNGGTRRLAVWRGERFVSDNFAYYNITLGTADWYHLMYVWNGTTQKLYVNGVERASLSDSGNGVDSDVTQGTWLGNNSGANLATIGTFDLLGVWTKAVSTQEISDLYNSGTGNAYREQVVAASTPMQVIWFL